MEPEIASVTPNPLRAQMGLIGCCLLEETVIDEVSLAVGSEHFTDADCSAVYACLCRLRQEGKPTDVVSVASSMAVLGSVDWYQLLTDCLGQEYSPSSASYYADVIFENWQKLQGVAELTEAAKRLTHEHASTPDDIIGDAIEALQKMLERKTSTVVTMETAMFGLLDRISQDPDEFAEPGVTTGFIGLDRLIDGFKPDRLYIAAARPSVGKTAWVVNAMAKVAAIGKRILFISLEQSRVEIAERFVASKAEVDSNKFWPGRLTEQEERTVGDVAASLAQLPVFIDDDPVQTVSQIEAKARLMQAKGGLDLIVIDYLQLIEPSNHKDIREQQVSKISRRLKQLTKKLHIPVLALAQINRAVDLRTDKKPKLADLRESGAIEQNADVVMFLHRPAMHADEKDSVDIHEAWLLVQKNRAGKIGEVKLHWEPAFTLFSNHHLDENPNPFGSGSYESFDRQLIEVL